MPSAAESGEDGRLALGRGREGSRTVQTQRPSTIVPVREERELGSNSSSLLYSLSRSLAGPQSLHARYFSLSPEATPTGESCSARPSDSGRVACSWKSPKERKSKRRRQACEKIASQQSLSAGSSAVLLTRRRTSTSLFDDRAERSIEHRPLRCIEAPRARQHQIERRVEAAPDGSQRMAGGEGSGGRRDANGVEVQTAAVRRILRRHLRIGWDKTAQVTALRNVARVSTDEQRGAHIRVLSAAML